MFLRLSTSPNILILSNFSQIFFYGLKYGMFYGEVRFGYTFSVNVAKTKKFEALQRRLVV